MSRRAAFLDRDGTLNVRPADHHWVTSLAEFAWVPGAPEAAGALARAGYLLAVVSNQRGISTGAVSIATLRAIEQSIQRRLAEEGCEIAAFAYCPHDLEAGCGCRKPRAGMITALARRLDIDLERSWVIGDGDEDVLAGQGAGCRTALVGDLVGECRSDIRAPTLRAAAALILSDASAAQPSKLSVSASNSSVNAW